MFFEIHGRAHWSIGGSMKTRPDQPSNPVDYNSPFPWQCLSFAAAFFPFQGVNQAAYNYDCFDCAYKTNGNFPCDPSTESPEECGLCSKANKCVIKGQNITITGTASGQYLFGDFLDVATSMNDPIFYGHHANLDRMLYIWQIKNYHLKPYYTYPTSGFSYGSNLNDPVADAGLYQQTENNYTYADIFDMTSILDSPYTYDTILDMIKPETDAPTTNAPSTAPTPALADGANSLRFMLYLNILVGIVVIYVCN